jgi:hypothetical protein
MEKYFWKNELSFYRAIIFTPIYVPRDVVEFFHFFGLSGLFGFFGPSEIGSPLSSLLIPQGRMHFMGQVKIVKIAHY